eukprot:scaffold3499_cov247-Pinguiococcus_pyrenoidosus.AAC.10
MDERTCQAPARPCLGIPGPARCRAPLEARLCPTTPGSAPSRSRAPRRCRPGSAARGPVRTRHRPRRPAASDWNVGRSPGPQDPVDGLDGRIDVADGTARIRPHHDGVGARRHPGPVRLRAVGEIRVQHPIRGREKLKRRRRGAPAIGGRCDAMRVVHGNLIWHRYHGDASEG